MEGRRGEMTRERDQQEDCSELPFNLFLENHSWKHVRTAEKMPRAKPTGVYVECPYRSIIAYLCREIARWEPCVIFYKNCIPLEEIFMGILRL